MEDATKYKPEVSWRSLAHNVHLVSKATVNSPAIYRLTVKAINTQEDGANKKEVGYYFMDNFGTPYSIVAVNGDQIDVQDDFRTKRCPRSEKEGIVYQSVADGDAPYVAGIFYRHLHPLAVQNARRFELDILWRKLYDEKYLLDPLQWKKNVIDTLVKFGFAIGLDNKVFGEQASAVGIGGVARSFREQALGSYGKDTPALSQNAWDVLDLLLTIGNGPDIDHRSNAVEVYKSGLTKIFNALLIGAYSHGDVQPVNGMIQYTAANGFEKWVDTEWKPFVSNSFPATITSSTVNEDNGTTHTHELESVDVTTVFESNPIIHGALYNWHAATDSRNIANTGWRVPTQTDFNTLIAYLGGSSVTGYKLKETGTVYWDAPNTGATNESNFNARGSGQRQGGFGSLKQYVAFWASTGSIGYPSYAYALCLSTSYTIANLYEYNYKYWGYSIRLIKDSTTLTHGQTGLYTGNDGKTYRTICIGTQEFLADNLSETKFRNGDWIHGFDGGVYTPIADATWIALTTDEMCYYGNNEANGGGDKTPLSELLHPPVTIHSNSATSLSIGDDQVLSYNPIEDLGFEFADVTAGTAHSYTLDIKATFAHTIESVSLETDNGTLTGVSVLINATPVTNMSSITVDMAVDTTLSTGAKTVAIGDRVYLSVSTGYTGTPTLIRGKLTTKRL